MLFFRAILFFYSIHIKTTVPNSSYDSPGSNGAAFDRFSVCENLPHVSCEWDERMCLCVYLLVCCSIPTHNGVNGVVSCVHNSFRISTTDDDGRRTHTH